MKSMLVKKFFLMDLGTGKLGLEVHVHLLRRCPNSSYMTCYVLVTFSTLKCF
jgi:hypothetical protein